MIGVVPFCAGPPPRDHVLVPRQSTQLKHPFIVVAGCTSITSDGAGYPVSRGVHSIGQRTEDGESHLPRSLRKRSPGFHEPAPTAVPSRAFVRFPQQSRNLRVCLRIGHPLSHHLLG